MNFKTFSEKKLVNSKSLSKYGARFQISFKICNKDLTAESSVTKVVPEKKKKNGKIAFAWII